MGLENLLAPFKKIDSEISIVAADVVARWEKRGVNKYSLSNRVVLYSSIPYFALIGGYLSSAGVDTLTSFISNEPPDLKVSAALEGWILGESVADSLIESKKCKKGMSDVLTGEELFDFGKFIRKVIRLPALGYGLYQGSQLASQVLTQGAGEILENPSLYFDFLWYTTAAISFYLKDVDDALKHKKPVWSRLYDKAIASIGQPVVNRLKLGVGSFALGFSGLG